MKDESKIMNPKYNILIHSLLGIAFSACLLFLFGCSEPDPKEGLDEKSYHIGMTLSHKNLRGFTLNRKPIALGSFSEISSPQKITIRNRTAHSLKIPYWRSPCPCIEFLDTPDKIEPGSEATFSCVINPVSYDGRIIKNIPLICQFETSETTLFLPIEFIATVEDKTLFAEELPQTVSPEQRIQYIEYSPAKSDSAYHGAAAWLFSGKNCSDCNHLKIHLFPGVFPKGSRIIQVNLDEKESLDLLLKLEKSLKVSSPGNAPVLYYGNRLFYGADAIRSLFENQGKEREAKRRRG